MKKVLAILGILVVVVMLTASTTINGDRIVHDLTITGACTGCGGISTPVSVANGGTALTTTLSQVPYCPDTSASTTTYTATCSPAPPSLAAGMQFTFVPANSNTGASTLAIGALGAKSIIAANTTGSALVADDLLAAGVYTLEYDGANFRKINGPTSAWTGFSYSNSWANFGSGLQVGQYKKDNFGNVYLRGIMTPGTQTAGITILTLPAGYRPATSSQLIYGVADNGGVQSARRLDLSTAGVLTLSAMGTDSNLNFIQGVFSVY